MQAMEININGNPGGFMFERYVDYKPKDKTYTIDGLQNFLTTLRKDVIDNSVGGEKLMDKYDYIRFGIRLSYIGSPTLVIDQAVAAKEEMDAYEEAHPSSGRTDSEQRELERLRRIYNDMLEETNPHVRFTTSIDLTDFGKLVKDLENINAKSGKQKAFVLENQEKFFDGDEYRCNYIAIPLAFGECEYADDINAYPGGSGKTGPIKAGITVDQFLDTIEEKYNDEIYENIKNILWETNSYKLLFDAILPLKDIISGFSMMQYAALSDEGVFPVAVENTNMLQITAKAKLSILQIFEGSIYGNGSFSYSDPFIAKVGTDLIY
jgi:hypothetical protein